MRAQAVIGSCFGDEGKGLITDYLVSRENPEAALVVRFNGGAQAGHTVVTPDGKRHVFSHFGSGTLAGAGTFLSEHFIVNPHLFVKEVGDLVRIGMDDALVLIDPRATVTTPFDMFINRAVERTRGDDRHGSVGVGINETVERSAHVGFKLTVADLWDKDRTVSLLRSIRERWVPARFHALQAAVDPEIGTSIKSDMAIDVFVDSVEVMKRRVHVVGASAAGRFARRIIFEGAQGLLLDQNRRQYFPHLTRSNTGLKNVMALCDEMRCIDHLETTYVMRPYMTRHGAGPLSNEGVPCQMVVATGPGETNKPHEFQGDFRIAPFDLSVVSKAIREDMVQWDTISVGGISFGLAVTCTDHLRNGLVSYSVDDKFWFENEPLGTFLSRTLPMEVGVKVRYVSAGPTRLSVRLAEPNLKAA